MANADDLSEQLVLTQKLANAIDSMAKSMAKVESSYENQIAAVEQLTQAFKDLKAQDTSQITQMKFDNLEKGAKDAATQVTSLTGKLKDLGQTAAKKVPTGLAAVTAGLTGIAQGVRNVIALGKGITGFFSGLVDGAFNIAAAIVAIPFKMFNALVDMAAAAEGGANELAQAIENLRKEMGDLKGPGASAVMETTKALKGFSDTGLNAYMVFGTLAERLEHVTKVAVAMGSTFSVLKDEFKQNGGALLAFQKGLGVTEEGMKAVGDRAITMGKPMTKVFMEMTKQTLALGKAFDLDQKLIGKDMTKALQDVKHFGALTVKEIGQASVYARKLGLELDKIVGTLDAFETFDSAAENAAKLSQSFGVTVDAFQMMEAQSPAEQIEMLRKSFRDAGVDASKFTRQQATLLAQTTGLDEATARQAFSTQNYGVSLDKVKKQSEAAEKKTMTQAEAMSKLADSIERMVKSGGAQSGGFWEMFVKGFLGGIQASKEFREIIWNIKRALQLVYYEGVKLGQAFVEMFPGVKQFLSGIADFFKPEKFKTLVGGVVTILKDWMKQLQDPNGKASFAGLMKNIREKFFDFFDSQSGPGKKMIEGFKTVFKTITNIVSDGIKWSSDMIADGLQYIIDLVTGKQSLDVDTSAANNGLGFLGEAFLKVADGLKHAWKVISPKVFELVLLLGKKLYSYLTSDEFLNILKPAMPAIAAVLFGPMFGRALLGAATASIGKAAMALFTTPDSKKVMQDVAKKAAQEVMEASKKANVADGANGLKNVGAVNKAAGEAINPSGGKDWGVKDAVKLGAKLVAIAAALAVGGVMMAGAIVLMKKTLDAGGIGGVSDVVAPLVVLGAMVASSVPLMLSLKLASKTGSMSDIVKGGLLISAAVGIVGVAGSAITYMLNSVGSPAELAAAGNLMLKMALVFGAMVPLIIASIAIGALASGPQAVALVAAAAGMAVIGAAVSEMASITMNIVTELNKLKIDASFQRKIDGFLGVMKSIQAFADTLVKVISMMTPSFVEIVSGKTESFSEKVTAARGLIAEMIGTKGSKTGMIGLVETVLDNVKHLNMGGPGMAEAANTFSNVIQAITSFMQAATPPESFFTEGGSFINRLMDPSHSFASLAQDVSFYTKMMRDGAMEMLTGSKDGKSTDGGVLGLIKGMAGLSVPDPASAEVISKLIASTAQILKTLTPSPETIKQFTNTTEVSAYWGFAKKNVSKLDAEGMATTIDAMGKQFAVLIPVLTSSVIKSVADAASGLSKDDLERIKSLGDVLRIVVDLTNAIGNATKGTTVNINQVNAGALVNVANAVPDITTVIEEIGNVFPSLMNSLVSVVRDVPSDKAFMKNLEVGKTLIGFLGEIPKLSEALSKVGTSSTPASADSTISTVESVSSFFEKIASGQGNPLETMFSSIKSVDSVLSKIKEALTPETLKNVSDSSGRIKEYTDHFTKITDAVKTGGIVPAITAISEMVKQTQAMDDQLSNLPKIGPVTAKLEAVAKAAGLGGKAVYTVKSKEIVMNVHLNVTMDAGEVEKVVIMRKTSIIRDRLNFATGEGAGEQGTPPIPETYQSSLPNVQKNSG